MKTFTLLLITILFSCNLFSQNICGFDPGSGIPPSPYSDGCLMFDGRGDFIRTSDDDRLDLIYSQTDNFTIETRIKITSPLRPMRILGKFYGTGWALIYHTIQSGVISFAIGNTAYDVYLLGSDTSWHTYKICFSKTGSTLKTYADNILTHEYTSFTYTSTSNDASFSIGNTGLASAHGLGTVNIYDSYFKGCVDFFRLNKNNSRLLNYDFNEGAGQFAKDSVSYYMTDRTMTGIPSCGDMHLMLGFVPASDTCDPSWVSGENTYASNFTSLSSGLSRFYAGGNDTSYSESNSMALTLWNGSLVTSGLFNRAGSIEAKFIASWDGSNWNPVGDGFNYEVKCLASYNGELYAGGFFTIANGFGERRHIARWDGSQWKSLGIGTDNVVNVMTEYRGELIVGGFFMSAGETYAPKIARWDGKTWHSMGFGMTGPVYALCEYNGWLYAAGSFQYAGTTVCNSIARWGGRGWEPVGTGTSGGSGEIFSLYVYNGELWAGGSFLYINGVSAKNIAKYNGVQWSAVGQGAGGINCVYTGGYITAMKEYNQLLYVTGVFTKMDGEYANKIARYNGTYWCPVEFGADLRPRALEVYDGSLIVSGDFYSISGREFGNIASYRLVPKIVLDNISNTNQKAVLSQNYPNPFNPATHIKFEIPLSRGVDAEGNGLPAVGRGVFTKLTIYDILGKEVAIVVNETLGPGTYDYEFNAGNLPSGVYFYKLIASDPSSGSGQVYTDVKRMLLVK